MHEVRIRATMGSGYVGGVVEGGRAVLSGGWCSVGGRWEGSASGVRVVRAARECADAQLGIFSVMKSLMAGRWRRRPPKPWHANDNTTPVLQDRKLTTLRARGVTASA